MKSIVISILVAGVIIGGAILYASSGSASSASPVGSAVPADNVKVENGKQIVEINAKGGYQPRKSVAKAGMPTVIRFNTNGTYDCSISVRIPSLNLSKLLTPSGVTDIDIGTQEAKVLKGTCGMGMYPFQIEFR